MNYQKDFELRRKNKLKILILRKNKLFNKTLNQSRNINKKIFRLSILMK